jgi:hypothetical protein
LYKIAFLFPWAFVQDSSSDIYREGFTTHSPNTFPHDFDSHTPFLKRIIFNCDFSFSHALTLFHLFLTPTNCRTLILLPPFSCLPDVLQGAPLTYQNAPGRFRELRILRHKVMRLQRMCLVVPAIAPRCWPSDYSAQRLELGGLIVRWKIGDAVHEQRR